MSRSAGTNFTRLVLVLLLMGALSGADIVRLNCSVAFPDGRVQYQLHPDLPQDCTDQGWEDENSTALTLGSEVDGNWVEDLRVQTLVLKKCLSRVRFRAQCHVFVEALCSVNCSSLFDLQKPSEPCAPVGPSTVNCSSLFDLQKPSEPCAPVGPSTESCSEEPRWRHRLLIVALVLFAAGLVLVLVSWLLLPKFRRWRHDFIQSRSPEELQEPGAEETQEPLTSVITA